MTGFFWFLSISGWRWGDALSTHDPIYLKATTICLTGIIVTQVANVLVCRSRLLSVSSLPLRTNWLIPLGIAIEITLLALIVYTSAGNSIVGTAPIPLTAWLFFIPFALLLLGFEEVRKFVVRKWYNIVAKTTI